MKVLTATRRTQGDRPGDFCWTIPGELVRFGMTCDRDRLNPEGPCGCGRSFAGLASSKATTTAEVRDLDMTRDDYLATLASNLQRNGWDSGDLHADLERYADELLDLAAWAGAGAVLERGVDYVTVRNYYDD